MPTTFANTINGNDIFAARATADASGNNIASTYATQSSVSAIRQVPAAAAADENKVLGVTDAQGSVGWVQGGGADVHTITIDQGWVPEHPRSMIFQMEGDITEEEDWEQGGMRYTLSPSRKFPAEGYSFYSGPNNDWTLNVIDATEGIYELVFNLSEREWRSTGWGGTWYSFGNVLQDWQNGYQRPFIKMLCVDLTDVTWFEGAFEYTGVWGEFHFHNTEYITRWAPGATYTDDKILTLMPSGESSTAWPLYLPRCTYFVFSNIYSVKGNLPDITLPNTGSVAVDWGFAGWGNASGGILDAYTTLSSNPAITSHTGCFNNAGLNSVTGSAERAQVPQSWGGTLVE